MPELSRNTFLDKAAEQLAEHLGQNGIVSHIGKNGINLNERISKLGLWKG